MVLTLTTLLGMAAAAIALGSGGREPRIPLWVGVLLLAIALLLQSIPIGK